MLARPRIAGGRKCQVSERAAGTVRPKGVRSCGGDNDYHRAQTLRYDHVGRSRLAAGLDRIEQLTEQLGTVGKMRSSNSTSAASIRREMQAATLTLKVAKDSGR